MNASSRTITSVATVCVALLASIAAAGPGHDHGDTAPAAIANGPQRQADGSVFLPKPAQRQLKVRTVAVIVADLARTTELAAKVMMDPNAGGKVQPTMAGRIDAGPKGLPNPGQPVKKGEVLAYVTPSAAAIERSNQASLVTELSASKALAEKKLARQKELADTVPRKDIEATESEVSSLAARINLLGQGINNREILIAPVTGVLAQSSVTNGQIVDAREVLFEIVDPTRLRIEALTFEPALAADIASASIAVGEKRAPLTFVGATRILREQALPLIFKANDATLSALAVGQPVRVFVQSATRVKAIAIPAASVMRNPSNQSIVWVKSAPEKFEPRVVMTEPLDGVSVAVTSGLQTGDRVVTSGATLINQVR
jgi:membrane fusion protein, heavy metal efflux system